MYFNTHIHTFREIDIPRRFLPLGLVRILATKPGFYLLAKLLNNINPFSDNDLLDRYVKFVEIGKLGNQTDIFNNCRRKYPEGTTFVILAMDMAYMDAGPVPRSYEDQIVELGSLALGNSNILPFIHVDPRRPNIMELLKKSVEDYGFKGVKMYPPLGYFPFDERLYPIYEYCQKHKLPIISHCSPYNPVHNKGSKKYIKELLKSSNYQIDTKGKNKKQLCSNFTFPNNWKQVLNDFPDLKICLAHFGSAYMWNKYLENNEMRNNWFVIIKQMMSEYDNLYSDISFTLYNKTFFPLLKELLQDNSIKDKILFGSDYYMVETKINEFGFYDNLKRYLGETDFNIIAKVNPSRFLFRTSGN